MATANKRPRVLVRLVDPQLYYAASGEWVSNAGEALDFGETSRAIQFAFENGFRKVELVFSHENPEMDVSFALHPRRVEEPVSWLAAFCRRVQFD